MNLGFRCVVLGATLAVALTAPSIAEEEAVDGLVEVVVGLLHDKDKDIRALALEQIRTEAKGAASTKAFAKELQKLPPDGQAGLLRALAARGDVTARPAVLESLASKDPAVKLEAIEALGALGEPVDVQTLVTLLASPSAAEQAAARASLVRLRGDQVSRLIAAGLQSGDASARVAMLEILTERRGIDTLDEIAKCGLDCDPGVRIAAMTSLGQLASADFIPQMVLGLFAAEPGRERDSAEKCIALVCNRADDPEKRAAPLIAEYKQHGPAEQRELLSALGRVGGPEALAIIESSIAETNPQSHEAGVRALCNWPNASVVPRLLEIAQGDESEALRIAALRATIRVAPLADERKDEERVALLQQALKMATRDEERLLALDRARTIRSLDALHLIVPYLDQTAFAEQACLSVVELAHHRTLRQPNKAEFNQVLDKVIATSQDEVVIDRAKRYQKDQTWVRPAK